MANIKYRNYFRYRLVSHSSKIKTESVLDYMSREKAIKYMLLAISVAKIFSKDPSTKVGAIFIDKKTHAIRSVGYNGFLPGMDDSDPVRLARPEKYYWSEHAERNAIYNSVTSLEDTICFTSMYSCIDCARGTIRKGCKLIVTVEPNEDFLSRWAESIAKTEQLYVEQNANLLMLTESELKAYYLNHHLSLFEPDDNFFNPHQTFKAIED